MLDGLVLLVEDSEDDVFFLRRAFAAAGITNPIHVAENGLDAINYLSGVGPFADRVQFPLPSFIFLDLKMPIASGFDVLAWLKGHSCLRIPVAVLTSSPQQKDRQRCRDLGASSYLVKPPTADMLKRCWSEFDEDLVPEAA